MADIELKPCPFCGGKRIRLGKVGFDEVFAECEKCGVCIYGGIVIDVITDKQKRSAAVELWNRRADNGTIH